jgi:hypothetical protein
MELIQKLSSSKSLLLSLNELEDRLLILVRQSAEYLAQECLMQRQFALAIELTRYRLKEFQVSERNDSDVAKCIEANLWFIRCVSFAGIGSLI